MKRKFTLNAHKKIIILMILAWSFYQVIYFTFQWAPHWSHPLTSPPYVFHRNVWKPTKVLHLPPLCDITHRKLRLFTHRWPHFDSEARDGSEVTDADFMQYTRYIYICIYIYIYATASLPASTASTSMDGRGMCSKKKEEPSAMKERQRPNAERKKSHISRQTATAYSLFYLAMH